MRSASKGRVSPRCELSLGVAGVSTATEFSIGSEFAGHRIDAVAGRGGMGVVYKATDLRLKRTVALKAIVPALSADPGFRRRFEQESEIAAGIRHPNVITIYAAGEFDDQLYITMEFIEGTDLLRLVRERGALDAKWVADVVGQTAQALQAAHSRGLVHRDVKPANILIAQENGGTQAYLTDFGLTKRTSSESALTQVGTFVGTLDYIAPEQLQGKRVDARADIYALGCVLYQAVSGQVPYPRDSDPAKIFAHMSTPPPSLRETAPWAPPGLDAVISRALQKDPGARYVSAQHLGNAAVAAVAAGHVAQQTTQPRSQPTPRTVAAPAPPPQPATSQAAAPPPPARPAAPPPPPPAPYQSRCPPAACEPRRAAAAPRLRRAAAAGLRRSAARRAPAR